MPFEIDEEKIAADVAQTVERMPDVSPHFNPGTDVEHGTAGTEQQPRAEAQQQSHGTTNGASGDVDAAGVAWNAEIHSATKTKNAKGEWRKRRKSSAAVTGVAPAPVVDPNLPKPLTPEEINICRINGRMAAKIEFMLFQSIFDKAEWTPSDQEYSELSGAWEEAAIYMRWCKQHPLMLPVTATIIYAAPRLSKPGEKTLSRIERGKMWFASKVLAYKQKRADKHAAKNPNAPKEVPKD